MVCGCRPPVIACHLKARAWWPVRLKWPRVITDWREFVSPGGAQGSRSSFAPRPRVAPQNMQLDSLWSSAGWLERKLAPNCCFGAPPFGRRACQAPEIQLARAELGSQSHLSAREIQFAISAKFNGSPPNGLSSIRQRLDAPRDAKLAAPRIIKRRRLEQGGEREHRGVNKQHQLR